MPTFPDRPRLAVKLLDERMRDHLPITPLPAPRAWTCEPCSTLP